MKVEFVCSQCALNAIHETKNIDLRDDSIYRFRCSQGHQVSVELACLRFELLYEIGISAIRESYYREAVSSFTASLERFYEFAIAVYSAKASSLAQSDLTIGDYESAWKSISNSSERQYGAYLLLHTALVGKEPRVLSDKERNFRNRVIHQGSYATKEQAVRYGDVVFSILREGIDILNTKFAPETHGTALNIRFGYRNKVAPGENLGSHFLPTLVDLFDDADSARSETKLTDIFGHDLEP